MDWAEGLIIVGLGLALFWVISGVIYSLSGPENLPLKGKDYVHIKDEEEQAIDKAIEKMENMNIPALIESASKPNPVAYLNPTNLTKDHVYIFDKQGQFIGVRACGHGEAIQHDRFNIYWPNGEEVECKHHTQLA